MKFEFDPAKSLSNEQKHGIDFEKAQQLWNDEKLLVIRARTATEFRFMAVGIVEDRHWSAVFTMRGEVVRLISVRRARPEEVDRYEGPRKSH